MRITYCADKEYYKYFDELNTIAKTICACNHEKKSEERLKPVSEFRENIYIYIYSLAPILVLVFLSLSFLCVCLFFKYYFRCGHPFQPIHNEYTHMREQRAAKCPFDRPSTQAKSISMCTNLGRCNPFRKKVELHLIDLLISFGLVCFVSLATQLRMNDSRTTNRNAMQCTK